VTRLLRRHRDALAGCGALREDFLAELLVRYAAPARRVTTRARSQQPIVGGRVSSPAARRRAHSRRSAAADGVEGVPECLAIGSGEVAPKRRVVGMPRRRRTSGNGRASARGPRSALYRAQQTRRSRAVQRAAKVMMSRAETYGDAAPPRLVERLVPRQDTPRRGYLTCMDMLSDVGRLEVGTSQSRLILIVSGTPADLNTDRTLLAAVFADSIT
jgi:hypothetical protein